MTLTRAGPECSGSGEPYLSHLEEPNPTWSVGAEAASVDESGSFLMAPSPNLVATPPRAGTYHLWGEGQVGLTVHRISIDSIIVLDAYAFAAKMASDCRNGKMCC